VAERSLLVIGWYGDKVPAMASCAKCQRKFFTPAIFSHDRAKAEEYMLKIFDLHDCQEELEK
jgi:hypothetical protein